tara:strand:- start:49822 stop:50574 length:753 start_codon:yes stop_codon:yes gene_type:complete
MTSIDQALFEINIFGYTLLRNVLKESQVESLRKSLIRCAQDHGEVDYKNRGGRSLLVRNLPTLDPIFFQIIDHPLVLPILERLLEKTLVLGSLSSRIVRPGDRAQDLHSDIPQHMLNLASPVMLNTVWMLNDFTPSIGGTRLVPGSHKSGLDAPPKGIKVPHVYQPEAKAGSVLIFNGQCWHGGGTNTSDSDRYALFSHYRKSMLLFQLDPHDEFPEEWFGLLSSRQKELLRMKTGLNVPHASDNHLEQG